MKNKPVVLILILCIVIAAAGLAYEFLVVKSGSPEDAGKTAGEDVRTLFKAKQQIDIDCLGDSLTWGMYSTPALEEAIDNGDIYTGLDDGGQLFEDVNIYVSSAYQSNPSYPEVLENDLNQKLSENTELAGTTVKTYNDGICGDWITKNSYRRMSCEHPDIVILLMGGNNFYYDIPIDGMFETNIEALKEQGAIIYLANYPHFPGEKHVEDFVAANAHIAMISEKFDLPLIDLCSAVNDTVTDEKERRQYFSPDHIHLSEKGYELIGHFIAETIWSDIVAQ